MKCSWLAKVIPALLIVAGSAFLYLWLGCDSGWYVTPRLPGNDGRPKNLAPKTQFPALAGKLEVIPHPAPIKPSALPGSWPRFRGADFDGISKDPVKLARTWPAEGPKVLWSLDVGEGYASPAIHAGRVYMIDYDRTAQADAIRCFSLDNGAEFWRYSYPVKVKRNHGMSRTIPAVTDRFIVTMGPLCHVACLDATSGELKWFLDLVADYGAEVPLWYAGQCPLIDNDRAILAPGGPNALMIAELLSACRQRDLRRYVEAKVRCDTVPGGFVMRGGRELFSAVVEVETCSPVFGNRMGDNEITEEPVVRIIA